MRFSRWMSTAVLLVGLLPAPATSADLSSDQLDNWLERFKLYRSDTLSQQPAGPVVPMLQELRNWTATKSAIMTFRTWNDNDDAVRSIIPFAAGYSEEARIPATLILANVVDNTNICYVIAYVKLAPEMDPSGRFNLLQVILQVSSYAYRDTAEWISDLVGELSKELKTEESAGKTKKILSLIQSRLQSRELGQGQSLSILFSGKYKNCMTALSAGGSEYLYVDDDDFSFSPEDLNSLLVRDILFSKERRKFASFLSSLYTTSPEPQKRLIASTLSNTIIDPGSDPDRRYRVNLYVAVTYSLLPTDATDNVQLEKLMSLKNTAEYRQDSTFRKNVDRAVDKQN